MLYTEECRRNSRFWTCETSFRRKRVEFTVRDQDAKTRAIIIPLVAVQPHCRPHGYGTTTPTGGRYADRSSPMTTTERGSVAYGRVSRLSADSPPPRPLSAATTSTLYAHEHADETLTITVIVFFFFLSGLMFSYYFSYHDVPSSSRRERITAVMFMNSHGTRHTT